MHPTLSQAVNALMQNTATRPKAEALVKALGETEKLSRKAKPLLTYEQLIGTWQLRFITGTKRSRQRAGQALGAGRFIPTWLIQIYLTYTQGDDLENQSLEQASANSEDTDPERIPPLGQVQNSVSWGPIKMMLSGPTRLWHQTNSLAFDFTHISIQLAGKTLYQGNIRGGKQRAQDFAQQSLKDQAFFTYFLVQDKCLAARGRGGGLALWTRHDE